MKWNSAMEQEDSELLRVPNDWLYPHYYEALNVLFRVENALRLLVYVVLKTEHGERWETLSLVTDDNQQTQIRALAKRRIEQDRRFGYLGYSIKSPLMYLTSGELVRLIVDTYWDKFTRYFPGSKDVVSLKLQEIGTVRNALAHFRPLRPDDVEVVKQNAKQVLSAAESALVDLLTCEDTVPSNLEERWFQRLRVIGSPSMTFRFHQSRDRRWITIRGSFKAKQLSPSPSGHAPFVNYRVTNLDSQAVLRHFPGLRDAVLLLTEAAKARVSKDRQMICGKSLRFTFAHQRLVEFADGIGDDLERLTAQIAEESELVAEDQLARGALVSGVSIRATARKIQEFEYWHVSTAALLPRNEEVEFSEYWGATSAAQPDFLSVTDRYPWMPVDIAKSEIPF